ncbi:MAG: serpin family protein [Actinobacteria bacterium]|nr:serpin family protein [Actinomycetota bacterium]
MRARITAAMLAALLALTAAACGDGGGSQGTTPAALVASDLERRAPDAPASDVAAVGAGNNAFAAAAYALLAAQEQGNLVYSPHSIRLALAMTYAGARGETAAQMAEVLRFDLADEALHAAFNALDQELASRNRVEPTRDDGIERKVQLSIANSLWGQQGFTFVPEFLDTLAADYGAGMRLVDYVAATEAARRAINEWVAEQTNDRITDLIPEGVLSEMTRLVLTNAVYLDATWSSIFEKDATYDAPFFRLDGSEVTVPTMHQQSFFRYAAGEGWQAVELPYVGEELAMVLLVPDAGRFPEVEGLLGAGLLDEVVAGLAGVEVNLALPKFEFRFKASVADLLKAMGMPTAFDPGAADFSGMSAEDRLFISDVIHEAFIKVDEEGTEAAAATAVIIDLTSAPIEVMELSVDRPFLFSLYDRTTGQVLFLGRVLDPAS